MTAVPANNSLILANYNFNQTKVNPSNDPNNNNLLILNMLTNSLESRLYGAASILEFASNLSGLKSIPNTTLLNATLERLHGIPSGSNLQKRNIAQEILTHHLDIAGISFILPNGDTYFMEPYSLQSNQTKNNIAVPVFSENGNGVLTGVLVGSVDLGLFNKELQSFNLSQGQRIVYVDSSDTKIADSDKRFSADSSE